MNTAKFKALNVEAPLPDRYYYFDSGYVDSVEDYIKFVCWKHNLSYEESYKPGRGRMLACYFEHQDGTGKYGYVIYPRQNNGYIDIRSRAHEETHAMDYLGVLQYLQNEMTRRGFGININDHDDEMRACLGGWFSYVMWNQELRVRENDRPVNQKDWEAFDILSRSRVKGLNSIKRFFDKLKSGG